MAATSTPHLFSFPYAPYEIQEQLMRAIYECLERGRIGIMESPTGTGKSLSTLCAALSWLEQSQQRESQQLTQEIERLRLRIKGRSYGRRAGKPRRT